MPRELIANIYIDPLTISIPITLGEGETIAQFKERLKEQLAKDKQFAEKAAYQNIEIELLEIKGNNEDVLLPLIDSHRFDIQVNVKLLTLPNNIHPQYFAASSQSYARIPEALAARANANANQYTNQKHFQALPPQSNTVSPSTGNFQFYIDLNRPQNLRDDFAEEAIRIALQQTFMVNVEDLNEHDAEMSPPIADITVCAFARINLKEEKEEHVPISVFTVQQGNDALLHLVSRDETQASKVISNQLLIPNTTVHLTALQELQTSVCTNGIQRSILPEDTKFDGLPKDKITMVAVSNHCDQQLQINFENNLNQALLNAKKSQDNLKPNEKISTFFNTLEKLLAKCEERVGGNHQGIKFIRAAFLQLKQEQNNPWAALEKLGKDIYDQHYTFWGKIRKYFTRDALVHELYSTLKQFYKQECNNPSKTMIDKIKLIHKLTQRLDAAPEKIQKLDDIDKNLTDKSLRS